MAALHFPGRHGPPLHHLRRDSCSHRLLPSRFLERVAMEPARLYDSLRLVDLRRLRFRRFGGSRAAIAPRATIHSSGKKLYSRRCRYPVVIELGLLALASTGFVLSSFQTLELGF